MYKNTLSRALQLARLFIKEQLKEPVALFWILLSPSAVFYLIAYSKRDSYFKQTYSVATAWFYAYISENCQGFYMISQRQFIHFEHGEAFKLRYKSTSLDQAFIKATVSD